MFINTTLYYKKYAYQRPGDEIMNILGKEFNVSELERQLQQLIGCGDAYIRFLNDERPTVAEISE